MSVPGLSDAAALCSCQMRFSRRCRGYKLGSACIINRWNGRPTQMLRYNTRRPALYPTLTSWQTPVMREKPLYSFRKLRTRQVDDVTSLQITCHLSPGLVASMQLNPSRISRRTDLGELQGADPAHACMMQAPNRLVHGKASDTHSRPMSLSILRGGCQMLTCTPVLA